MSLRACWKAKKRRELLKKNKNLQLVTSPMIKEEEEEGKNPINLLN